MRRSIRRGAPSFAVVVLATGCSLTFAPGDFSGPSDDAAAPSSDASTTPETSLPFDGGVEASTPNETGGPPPPSRHVLLFAGTKDGADTNDVWTAPVTSDGALGAFEYLQPTPLTKPLQAAALSGGKLLTVVQGSSSRVAQTVDFDDGLRSAWTTAVIPNPPRAAYGSFFAKTSLVVAGGQTSEEVDDGSGTGSTVTVTTNRVELLVNEASGAQYPAPNNAVSATKLPVGVHGPTIVLYKDFVYLWGPGDASTQASKVYFGSADAALGLTSVTATAPIVAQDAKPHTPTAPIACAGADRLFVIGGEGTMTTTVSADIDATGALGTWKTGPDLPFGRSRGACAVLEGYVYVFGGKLASNAPQPNKPTDEILRSRIEADGTMTEWETTTQRLPGPRSNVFALTY